VAAENETGFECEGRIYPVPTLDTFNMDEAQVLYDYSGLSIEDFAIDESDPEQVAELERKAKNPGFKRALMHIAYQRGNPSWPAGKVRDLAGSANLLSTTAALYSGGGDAEVPPAPTTEPGEPLPSGPVELNESSGQSSGNGSDEQVDRPTPIGIGRSATSSPESPLTTSVV
jgi:hypothetical protein